MRNLLFGGILAALGGLALGCGSSDEGRTIVVHERPVVAKPAPAPAPTYDYDLDTEFDDDFESEVEIEIDD